MLSTRLKRLKSIGFDAYGKDFGDLHEALLWSFTKVHASDLKGLLIKLKALSAHGRDLWH
jgi:hypothetical protein